jgi:hypothetical protein
MPMTLPDARPPEHHSLRGIGCAPKKCGAKVMLARTMYGDKGAVRELGNQLPNDRPMTT